MDVVVAKHVGDTTLVDKTEHFDLSFLPTSLTTQCRSLIESYHELHGYACLPDILWKSRLGPLIDRIGSFDSYSGRLRRPEAQRNPTKASYE